MNTLKLAAGIVGAVMLVVGTVAAATPASFQKWMARFPRSKWPAWILTAIDLIWSAWLLFHMPMERFEQFKPLLYVLTPVAFLLIITLMDELLAPRALGGLFLLVPLPLLESARWHPSPLRVVAVVLAYVLVVKGMVLVLSPYQFRRAAQRLLATPSTCRAWAGVMAVSGILLLTLAGVAY